MKCFALGFLFTILVSAAFADIDVNSIEMISFQEYSDGKFYSQFVELFNKEYNIAGFGENIIPNQDKNFLLSKIPSRYRSYNIVIMSYWLDNNTLSPFYGAGQYLTVFYFNRDGEYVSSSWMMAH